MRPKLLSCICIQLLFVVISSASARSIAVNEEKLNDDFVGELETEEENEKLLQALALTRRTLCRYITQCRKYLREERNLPVARDSTRTQVARNSHYAGDSGNPQMGRTGYKVRHDDTNTPQMERNGYGANDAGTPQMERTGYKVRHDDTDTPQMERNGYGANDAGTPQMERNVYDTRRNNAGDSRSPQMERNVRRPGEIWTPQMGRKINYANDNGSPQMERNVNDARQYDVGDIWSPQMERQVNDARQYDVGDIWSPQMERSAYDERRLNTGDKYSPQIKRNFPDAGNALGLQLEGVRSKEVSADEIVGYLIKLAREKKHKV